MLQSHVRAHLIGHQMKRWQDRGVVEDSEDDDISLGAASPSPEPPRKRTEPDQHPILPKQQDDAIPEALSNWEDALQRIEDEPWIGPKAAITYVQKTKAKTGPRTPPEPMPERTYASPRVVIFIESESGERLPAVQQFDTAEIGSTPESDSDSLPELGPILRKPADEARKRPLSTAPPPLSERNKSPSAVSSSADRLSHQVGPNTESILDDSRVGSESSGLKSIAPTSTAVAKRKLRARKPNQLNPYQYDRALYLQQCKARGVQPIRLVAQPEDKDESQSQSHEDTNPSQDAPHFGSSPVDAQRASIRDSFDILPSDLERDMTSGNRPPKRRKLGDRAHALEIIASAGSPRRQREEFSVPPSPPRTGSDLSTVDEAPSGFKMPRRMTPLPLPTPQTSSDFKRAEADNDSTPESSTVRTRSSTVKRLRRRVSVVSLLSDSPPESDLEMKRFRRERKRIKGVLPASWLRIDFRAPRPREVMVANMRQRSPSTSPERQQPQRGIAQRVVRRCAQIDDSPSPLLSGADSGSDSSVGSLARLKQRKLGTRSAQLAFARQNTLDGDIMENDFIDPMLAGPSRSRNTKKSRGHQPRITQGPKTSATSKPDYANERVFDAKATTTERRHARINNTERRRVAVSRPPPVRLSIADVLDEGKANLPAFVKLALRQTRNHQDQGRHSPTHKVLRLATAEDTDDASSTLRAWLERGIAPKVIRPRKSLPENGYTPHQGPDVRAAIAEISNNQHFLTFNEPADEGIDQPRPSEHARRKESEQTIPHSPAFQIADSKEKALIKSTSKRRLRPSMRPWRLRDAQLEALEDSFDQDHRSAVFGRRMQCLTEHVARQARQHRQAEFQLDRYLHIDRHPGATPNECTRQVRSPSDNSTGTRGPSRAVTIPYRPKKRQARRLNVEAREYRQPSEPLSDNTIMIVDEKEAHETPKAVLQDLGPFGTRYPVAFDIRPIPVGSAFDKTSFIGSGELHDALILCKQNLDEQRGCMRVQLESEVLEWSVWQDEVAVHISRIAAAIQNYLNVCRGTDDRENGDHQVSEVISYLLRSVIRYFAQCVSFSDSIDRLACVEHLHWLVTGLSEILAEHQHIAPMRLAVTRILQYSTVLASQTMQLCDHRVIPATTTMKVKKLLLSAAERLASYAVKEHFNELRIAYEDSHKAHDLESGFKDKVPALSSLIILENALRDTHGSTADFWTNLLPLLTLDNGATCSVKRLEKAWHDLFTILPALSIDSHGVARIRCSSTASAVAWKIPQLLLKRAFDLYEASSAVRRASVNDYVRTLLSRCLYLVNDWGCFQSDLALSTIYDFFAQRNLHLLNGEESRGSPSFLQDTGEEALLQIQPDDRSFHIFLKMLTASLKSMQAHGFPLRKLQSIVFRLTPNHARTYRKDATLVKADLEALRNHYDLLCTLYCAAPAGSRPSVYLLQNLIDHSTSHREACRVSVKAWAHVAVFQAAGEGSADCLQALIEWYSDIVKTTVTQYRLAKSEAERDFEVAQSEARDAGSDVPAAILESTIANNQVQIATTLVDALAGLKRALQSTSDTKTVKALVEGTGFMSILELFDPTQRRLLSTMMEVLAVISAAVDAESRLTGHFSQQEGGEDSQEFGDIDALQAIAEDDIASLGHGVAPIAGMLLSPVGHFLSNVFGADVAADDSLLMAIVDTWTGLAKSAGRPHNRKWHSYIDEYSPTSWNQMRDTTHRRKYTPYFLSCLVEESGGSQDIKQAVLSTWLLSLVDREAMLKFQHSLTSTVLDHWSHEPLLSNLPFASDPTSGKYHITLTQLRERRVALVSSVLCNMQEHYDRTVRSHRARSSELRSAYSDMLRQLMNAMKSHYQELQTCASANVADAGTTGPYVEFVQQVVASLQQYTAEVCPVDRFFMDSSAFPLPAGDPTYVVGRLRGYAPKLREGQNRAQLAVFIQTVIERALIDGQKDYLIDQISTAMVEADMVSMARPTLWQVMSQSILPVYISRGFETSTSWIAAVPVLQACVKTVLELFYNVDVGETAVVEVITSTLGSVLHSIGQQITSVLIQTNLLGLAHVLKLLGAMMMVGQASTTFITFLERSAITNQGLCAHLHVLHSQALALRARLANTKHDGLLDLPKEAFPPDCAWQDTRTFTEKQLRETIETNWYSDNGRYFVRRGNATRELAVQLDDAAVERERLLQAVSNFCKTYDATRNHRCRQRHASKACDDILGEIEV
ncbi:hypothetical protein DOTSEDRAFT_49083 [Dothistroma septosporum NZE10]|uniref:Uncharacterized protein n=1 Tax=Dothistroma septosporum (strain NZE10 / CBS 128990) TaxID=675120 RepID=N1Q1Z7_DOTSN|nr:hypothetical protein DOTSEDRAFT_49083 [Dothistroma septosporum NZE10]